MIFEKLTEREKETAKYIAAGLKNNEIAEIMGVTKHTIKVFVSSLLRKTNTKNRTQLVYLIATDTELNQLIFQSAKN